MNRSLCEDLVPNAFYHISTLLLFGLSLGGVVGNLILIQKLRSCSVLPQSVILLLFNTSIAALVFNLTALGRGVYHVVSSTRGFSATAVTAYNCIFWEAPHSISGSVLGLSILSLGVERIVATFKRDFHAQCLDTDNQSKLKLRHVVLVSTVVLCWIFGFVTVGCQAKFLPPETGTVCYCHVIIPFDTSILTILGPGYALLSIFSMSIFIMLLLVGKRRWELRTLNTALHPLSERFHVWRVVEVGKIMLPSALLSGICWASAFGSSFLINSAFLADQSMRNIGFLLAFTQLPATIHAALHAWLCLFMMDYLKLPIHSRAADNRLVEVPRNVVVSFHASPASAQTMLEDMWKAQRKSFRGASPQGMKSDTLFEQM